MLPLCERVVRVSRSKYLPSRNRGIPVPSVPTTIGGHLRKRRLELRLKQSEVAQIMAISTVSLSRWETDKVYPKWAQQPTVVKFLGFNPFTNPELGRPLGNETKRVASFSPAAPETFGQLLRKRRLEMRKCRQQLAQELGVSWKTLWNWETDRRKPSVKVRERIKAVTMESGCQA